MLEAAVTSDTQEPKKSPEIKRSVHPSFGRIPRPHWHCFYWTSHLTWLGLLDEQYINTGQQLTAVFFVEKILILCIYSCAYWTCVLNGPHSRKFKAVAAATGGQNWLKCGKSGGVRTLSAVTFMSNCEWAFWRWWWQCVELSLPVEKNLLKLGCR